MDNCISIIVPMHNASKYIEATVNSVLSQTESDFELLLVDDCSEDSTCEVVSRFRDERIRLIRLSDNMGAYAARNMGLSEAKGRFIAFLDADDIWAFDKLEKEKKFLLSNGYGFVFTGYEFADEDARGLGKVVEVPAQISYKQALHNTTIFTSTVMIDREIVSDDLIKMPDIKSEDTATWWQILREHKYGYGLNENLVLYRRSGNSLSANKVEALRRIWILYRKNAGLNVFEAGFHFCIWAFLAVKRRV